MLVCGEHACVSESETVSQKWQEEATVKPRKASLSTRPPACPDHPKTPRQGRGAQEEQT